MAQACYYNTNNWIHLHQFPFLHSLLANVSSYMYKNNQFPHMDSSNWSWVKTLYLMQKISGMLKLGDRTRMRKEFDEFMQGIRLQILNITENSWCTLEAEEEHLAESAGGWPVSGGQYKPCLLPSSCPPSFGCFASSFVGVPWASVGHPLEHRIVGTFCSSFWSDSVGHWDKGQSMNQGSQWGLWTVHWR